MPGKSALTHVGRHGGGLARAGTPERKKLDIRAPSWVTIKRMEHPRIIQGGLESMVATWPLANAVARTGQLGVVAGTLLPVIVARRLQLGDPDGHLRRAFEHFPHPGVARRVWDEFFVPGGKAADNPFAPIHQPHVGQGPALTELTVLAGFAETFLAREGHAGPVGVHFQPSAELPLLPTLYGALLAGAPYLLLHHRHAGAVLDGIEALCQGRAADWTLPVAGAAAAERPPCCFDPAQLAAGRPLRLAAPRMLVVGPSATELTAVVEAKPAHLAGVIRQPLKAAAFPETAELAALRALGYPFWLAGLPATHEQFEAALTAGAAGVVVSTPFYYCAESELAPAWKERVFEHSQPPAATISAPPGHPATPQAPARLDVEFMPSPTGFNVPVVPITGTAADPEQFAARPRFCDVGFLRQLYRREDGSVGYRCPGETVECHVAKGGDARRAAAQHCLCNGLLAALGLGQVRAAGALEPPLLPAGEDLGVLARFRVDGQTTFAAADVVAALLEG